RDGVFEPEIVDCRDTVPGAENQIDEVLALECLAEPVRKTEVSLITGAPQDFRGAGKIGAADKDVEVFGVTLDPGVARKCVGAAHEIRQPLLIEQAQRVTIKIATLLIQERRWCTREG